MTLVLEESEDISVDLLSSILDVLKTENQVSYNMSVTKTFIFDHLE